MLTAHRNMSGQRGMTLIETMVALVIGLVVIGAMAGMMANTLGTGTRTIRMSNLQQEMRTAMQMVTRDIRRANYTAEAILCFGYLHCADDTTLFPNGTPGDITLNSANNCVIFEMDRDHDGDSTENAPGGFRLRVANNIGRIQMWTGAGNATCTDTSAQWVDVTNPDILDVDEFLICEWIDAADAECSGLLAGGGDDPNMPALLTYEDLVDDDGAGNLTNLRVRKIQFRMTARLRADATISKTLIDRIRIRNDIIVAGA